MARTAKRSGKARPALRFNHAMVYSRDVAASLRFYQDLLGFRLIEQVDHEGRPVYARLRGPPTGGTLALHYDESLTRSRRDGEVRLYFEVRALELLCRRLRAAGVRFSQPPKVMPWGWKHAYLNDPDGHEISLYWAGKRRFERTED